MELIAILVVVSYFLYRKFWRRKDSIEYRVVDILESVFLAAEKAGHLYPDHFARSVHWAKGVLDDKNKYVVIDTETTGMGKKEVIVQISITDLAGAPLLDSLVKPTKKKSIPPAATKVHGIDISMLADAPTFADLLPKIGEICMGKTALFYNEEYDVRMIDQTCEQDDLPFLRFNSTDCVMIKYAEFFGQYSEYHGDYRFQKLPGGDHSALGDCRATIKVIEKMASYWPDNQ